MDNYQKLDTVIDKKIILPIITVHGRFQPPLHQNHWGYIQSALNVAEKIIVLITNPYNSEGSVHSAAHRSKQENNPFSYDERISIFSSFFKNIGISENRYELKPFDITNETSWDSVLDRTIPNLINTYSPWSYEKLNKFLKSGYSVIHSTSQPKTAVSGTLIRSIINQGLDQETMSKKLIDVGYMKEAIQGLLRVLNNRS